MSVEYEIQGDYGYGHGWECVCSEETLEEAEARLKEYDENEPEVRHRIRKVISCPTSQ